jgi:hypothetical protein
MYSVADIRKNRGVSYLCQNLIEIKVCDIKDD